MFRSALRGAFIFRCRSISSVIAIIKCMSKQKNTRGEDKLALGIALGVPYGMLFGIILGITVLQNIGLGIAIGMPLGVVGGLLYGMYTNKRK